jgi:hypothetical protein
MPVETDVRESRDRVLRVVSKMFRWLALLALVCSLVVDFVRAVSIG